LEAALADSAPKIQLAHLQALLFVDFHNPAWYR
jgi:hypothetical protein